MPNFKNAFKCNKCPESNSAKGCPCWTELTMVSDNGEHRIDKKCLFQMLPMLMVEVIKSTNINSEHSSVARNEIVNGFESLIRTIQSPLKLKEADGS